MQLCALQAWVKHKGLRVIVIFEGRDAAGKGGIIKALTERVSPRVFRVVALPAPSDREKSQMYIQRYMQHFPAAGEVVIFDRSWYNRAGVEYVMGFCTEKQRDRFLEVCPHVENFIVESGIILVKFWLEVSDKEQKRRFEARIEDPLRQWKLSPMDLPSRERWYQYSRARDAMLAATDTEHAPWHIVRSDDKKAARLNCIAHLLSLIPLREGAAREDQAAEALQQGRVRRRGAARGASVHSVHLLTNHIETKESSMKRLIGIAAALVVSAGVASAQDVGYNYDQQADFTKFKTYKWVEVAGGEKVDDIVDSQIKAAIDKQLALKGMTKTDADTADLYVGFQVATSTEKQLTTYSSGYAMGPGWGGRYYGGYYGGAYAGGTTTATTSTIRIGTVALDMYDAAQKKLVWRGMASKQLDPKAKPEKRQKNLEKGAAKLLKDFPPKPKS